MPERLTATIHQSESQRVKAARVLHWSVPEWRTKKRIEFEKLQHLIDARRLIASTHRTDECRPALEGSCSKVKKVLVTLPHASALASCSFSSTSLSCISHFSSSVKVIFFLSASFNFASRVLMAFFASFEANFTFTSI